MFWVKLLYRPDAHDIISVGRPHLQVKRRLFIGQYLALHVQICGLQLFSHCFSYKMAAGWRQSMRSKATSRRPNPDTIVYKFIRFFFLEVVYAKQVNKIQPSYLFQNKHCPYLNRTLPPRIWFNYLPIILIFGWSLGIFFAEIWNPKTPVFRN